MKHAVEIKITADVPDGNSDIAHEAIVQSRDPVNALIALLDKLGLTGATATRHIVRRSGVRPVAAVAKAAE